MATLITLVVFGIIAALFANQNNSGATIYLGSTTLQNIPLYLVVLGSMLVGLIMAWVINLIEGVFTGVKILGKNQAIKSGQKELEKLQGKIHELEIENAKLKG